MKKLLAILLAMISAFTLVGCSPKTVESQTRTPEEVFTYTFGNLSKDQMPVGAFSGPNSKKFVGGVNYPSIITDKSFSLLKEAGLNVIFGIENWVESNFTQIKETLALTDKYDINYVVYDAVICFLGKDDKRVASSVEAVQDRLDVYNGYTSFAGLYCKDEPQVEYYPYMKQMEDFVNQAYPDGNKICYSNMFPMFGKLVNGVDLGNEIYTENDEGLQAFVTYDEYIERYVEEVQPKYLSFDWYPFGRQADAITGNWFESLSVIRKHAENAKIPFWSCIQAGGMWENEINRIPNEREFNWNINTSLAYGAKGITYFPGVHSFYHVDNANGNEGLLDLNGNTTDFWSYSKNIKGHLSAIDDILMNSRSLGVMASGYTPRKLSDQHITIFDTFRELQEIKGDLLIGCFDYKGKTALYVVNNSLSKDTKAQLTFDDNYAYTLIKRGNTSEVSGKKVDIVLAAGEGALLVLK